MVMHASAFVCVEVSGWRVVPATSGLQAAYERRVSAIFQMHGPRTGATSHIAVYGKALCSQEHIKLATHERGNGREKNGPRLRPLAERRQRQRSWGGYRHDSVGGSEDK